MSAEVVANYASAFTPFVEMKVKEAMKEMDRADEEKDEVELGQNTVREELLEQVRARAVGAAADMLTCTLFGYNPLDCSSFQSLTSATLPDLVAHRANRVDIMGRNAMKRTLVRQHELKADDIEGPLMDDGHFGLDPRDYRPFQELL
ncbi:hypothetical protein FQN50_001931 [Emmonsiellopsis sp. PD_5]|nr:hypothetical protein FQN50_001931 [Emmonsiellopsis sp. PD_5]